MAQHYSVRRSCFERDKFKVVLAGGFWGYEDVDLPLFKTIAEALAAAERLEALRKGK